MVLFPLLMVIWLKSDPLTSARKNWKVKTMYEYKVTIHTDLDLPELEKLLDSMHYNYDGIYDMSFGEIEFIKKQEEES